MAGPSILRSTVFRLTLATVIVLGLAAAVAIRIVGGEANRVLTQSTEEAIQADVRTLRSVLEAGGVDALAAAVADRSHAAGPALFYLADSAGQKRAGNMAAPPGALDDHVGLSTRRGVFRYRPAGAAPTSPMRTAAGVRIDVGRGGLLLVGRDIEEQRLLLSTLYTRLAAGLAMLAALGIAAGALLGRYILSRIGRMSAASAAIVSGNLSERIPITGSGDELDRLAGQLNTMLDRIENLMQGLREVSDNIAHDLRTPLNRLRNRAEAALGDERGGTAWRTGLERTIEDADELIKTFNALLLIAKLEAGTLRETFDNLDLTALVCGVAELYEPTAEDAGTRIACETAGGVLVRGNPQLLGQAVANLVDNAVKYSSGVQPARGPITVTLAVEAGEAVLSVGDRGPGIATADRERVLRRFVRLDDSRGTAPGTGLGLSLVAAVTRMHHGVLQLADNAPGLKVVLRLPLAETVAEDVKPQTQMAVREARAVT